MKKNTIWRNFFYWGLFALLLVAVSSIGRRYIFISGSDSSGMLNLLGLFAFLTAYFIQAFLGYVGQLLFGLLSGYRFLLFRISCFVWVSDGKRVRFMRDPAAVGFLRCTMAPPVRKNGGMPVALYKLGGVFMHLLSASAAILGSWLFREMPMLSTWLLDFAAAGFYMALVNGAPIRNGAFSSEGYDAYYLHKNSAARRAFWILMEKCG